MTIRGVWTALITPFQRDESIDIAALRRLVDAQIAGGVDGLVPVGTTGESPTVTHEENLEIVELVVKFADGRVPVIAGTGSNSTREAVAMSRRAKDLGAAGTLQVAPYYNRPSQEGLYRHYMTIADEIDLPYILYNIPGRTGRNVEVETIVRLATHPNLRAIKAASGDVAQFTAMIEQLPERVPVLSGDDALGFVIAMLGGGGVVSVASNVVPARIVELDRAARSGDVATARRLHYQLMPLFRALFLDSNPIPVKYVMSRLGLCEPVYRLPLVPPSPEVASRLDEIARAIST